MALLVGSLVVSFGIMLLREVGAVTGGTAGLAFIAHYVTGVSYGAAFFVINLPFYYLSIRRMGWAFTGKTFAAVALVSIFSDLHPRFITLDDLNPFYASVFGGSIIGLGLIILFRHRASLGGVNILALYLQERFGIRAGIVQMIVDVTIVIASLFLLNWVTLVASIIGAVLLNLIIAMNHKPFRYLA